MNSPITNHETGKITLVEYSFRKRKQINKKGCAIIQIG